MKVQASRFNVQAAVFLAAILTIAATGAIGASTNGFTVTTYRGYTFSPHEFPTTEKLNQLGQPSFFISGTNLSLPIGAKSIDGAQLTNTLPDNVTLDYNGSSPRALEVKTAGISTNQLDGAGALGNGLVQGGTNRIIVDFHSVLDAGIFTTSGGQLNFNGSAANLLLGGTPGSVLGTATSTNVVDCIVQGPLAFFPGSGMGVTNVGTNFFFNQSPGRFFPYLAHGFGTTPRRLRWVLLNVTAGLGYVPGDEIDIGQVRAQFAPGNTQRFASVANTTNVAVVAPGPNGWTVLNKSTGSPSPISSQGTWELKAYAEQ